MLIDLSERYLSLPDRQLRKLIDARVVPYRKILPRIRPAGLLGAMQIMAAAASGGNVQDTLW